MKVATSRISPDISPALDASTLFERLIEAERRAAAAEAQNAMLREELERVRVIQAADEEERRAGARDRQRRSREKRGLSHADDVTSRDVTVTPRDPLPPSVPLDPHTPINPSSPPRPDTADTTAAARVADPDGFDALAKRLDADGTTELVAFLLRLESHDRRRSWIRRLIGSLDGLGGTAWTPAEITAAIGDMNANGEQNRARFAGYLALHRAAQLTPPPAGAAAAGSTGPTSRRQPPAWKVEKEAKSAARLIFGELRNNVRETLRKADGHDSNYRVVEIPPAVLEELSQPAKRALRAIGGPRAITSCEGDEQRLAILSGQFADAYAGALALDAS